MNKKGAIVVIEDDLDDQDLLRSAFKDLNYSNEIIFFNDGVQAFKYLSSSAEQSFLILSDINMPKLGGMELRNKIANNVQLRLKCIPYLLFTTTVKQEDVVEAYAQSIQGFFTKPNTYLEIKRVMRNIVEYWMDCHSPDVIE